MLRALIQSVLMLNVVMLCRYAECRYAVCRHAECRGAKKITPTKMFIATIKKCREEKML